MPYRTLLLFGSPGSGKGTQGTILGRIPGYCHISSGDLFRNLRVGSPLAKVFLDYSSRGALVPDDFTIQLWTDYVNRLVQTQNFDPAADTLILDGIPRNVNQARLLSGTLDVRRIYYLECKDSRVIHDRLRRRALYDNRLDDASEQVIAKRLYVYEAETAPLLNYYPGDDIRRIDTGRSPVEVLADILADMRQIVQEDSLHTPQDGHDVVDDPHLVVNKT